MRSISPTLLVLAGTFLTTSVSGCLYFNATLTDTALTVNSWDDANNNNATNAEDIICAGTDLAPTAPGQWTVPCSSVDNAKSDTVFDVFLEPTTKRFLDIIYRYSNPGAEGLQLAAGGENPDEFYFNFRVASVDGSFFKAREFCAQYDILRLIKPEAVKNECDSLDTC